MRTARWLIPIGMVSWEPGNPGHFVERDEARARPSRARRDSTRGSSPARSKRPVDTCASTTGPPTTRRSSHPTNCCGSKARSASTAARVSTAPTRSSSFVRTPKRRVSRSRCCAATTPPGVKLQAVIGEETTGANRFAVGHKTGVDPATNLDIHAETLVVTDAGRVGIGTSTPGAPLHVPADGIQIGTSTDPTDNFHVQVNADGPQGLRVYNGDMGAGTHVASFTQTGRLGIGTNDPTQPLHVRGDLGLRQNRLYMSGGANNWSSITFNAHHSADGGSWVFPDPAVPAVTIEMDAVGGPSRFEVYSTLLGDNTAWRSRLRVDGHNGNVGMAARRRQCRHRHVQSRGQARRPRRDPVRVEPAPGGREHRRAGRVGTRQRERQSSRTATSFTVVRIGDRRYEIIFLAPFPSPPAVIAGSIWGAFGATGGAAVEPRENALVDQHPAHRARSSLPVTSTAT